jgi:DNA-binding transcriptional MerR regulator
MNKPNNNNNRYTSQRVAEILGIYKRTLFNWEAAGKIPKAKRDPINNYRYYTKEDVALLKKITKR